jgi:hypothetical protein
MSWTDKVNVHALDWLLEKDAENPSVRYFALRDLKDLPSDDAQLKGAFQDISKSGPIPKILAEQKDEGYWEKPGPGYLPKYRSTVWQIIFLAQLGAKISDERVRKGCHYLLDNAIAKTRGISMSATASGAIHCLQGNLCAALYDLGCRDDPRLLNAVEWMACSVTGDEYMHPDQGSAPIRYYRSGISGPGFLCSANDHKPCAWGAVKVALALSRVPEEKRSPAVKKATQMCIEFLLSTDPAGADYPHPYAPKPSQSWFKIGFPVFYVTDVLQILEALVDLDLAGDKRLKNLADLVTEKAGDDGRWKMEYTYNGKTSAIIEEKKQPSKWVTLRALRALKKFYS